MIGLDTTAIIDIFKGDLKIKKILNENKEPLTTTELNYLEIMFGLDPEKEKHQLEEIYYDDFFNKLLNFNLTKKASKKASEISWKLKKNGKTIEHFDCTIAALFLTNGINKIITRNIKHFENIKELKVIGY